MSTSFKIAVVKCVTVGVLSIIGMIVYTANLPTDDEDIISAATDACVFEKRLQRAEESIKSCLSTGDNRLGYINNCYAVAYTHAGIPYYLDTEQSNKPVVNNNAFSNYISNKRVGALPLHNGKPYVANCTIW